MPRPSALKAFKFVGDNTGFLHIGPNQMVTAQTANHDQFGVNVFLHKDGHFALPPKFTCYDIVITVRFVSDISVEVMLKSWLVIHVCDPVSQ